MSFLPSFLRRNKTAPRPQEDADFLSIRLGILNLLLVAGSVLGILAYFSNIFTLVRTEQWLTAGVQTALIALAIFLTIFDRLGYQARAVLFLGILYALAINDLMDDGLPGEGRLFLLVFTIVAFVLLKFRHAIFSTLISLVSLIVVSVLMVRGSLPQPEMTQFDSTLSSNWITGIAVYVLMTALCLYALFSIMRGLQTGLGEQKKLTAELENERRNLEGSIQQRTAELQKRAAYMEITSQNGQNLIQLNQLDAILAAGARCFQEKLGYNELVAYLLDENQQMMAARLWRGENSEQLTLEYPLVTTAAPGTFASLAIKGQPRLLRNHGDDAVIFRGPVAQMNSAVVLPLLISNAVTGYIVLLSAEYREISMGDLMLYQNIAGQIASNVERARLIALLEQSVEELKTSTRQATQHNWRAYLKASRRKTSYRYNRDGIQSDVQQESESAEALKLGKIVVTPLETNEAGAPAMVALAAPIILRDQPLGVINLRLTGSTVPADMMHMVEAVTKRLALALENARLVEEVQQRAEREAAVGVISSRVRSSNDIDGILKTAAQEIGRSLGVSEVVVQLRNEN